MRCAVRAGYLAIALGDPAAALQVRELIDAGELAYPFRPARAVSRDSAPVRFRSKTVQDATTGPQGAGTLGDRRTPCQTPLRLPHGTLARQRASE
jgi:hypothetical protein